MRTAALVLLGYVVALSLGVLWRELPLGPLADTPPDVAALTAGYLGLTARRGVAGAVAGAVAAGYLSDLLAGTPPGMLALVAGLTCVLGHLVQRRILVRGWAVLGFAAGLGATAALLTFLLRLAVGAAAGGARELLLVVSMALTTAAFGPLLLRLYRRVDAAFARTHREREHALEGLVS
jgi:hypothetical protein